MKRMLQLVLLAAAALVHPLWSGDVIDRIVVLVNGQPVLLSEWDEAVRYEAMAQGRPLESVTHEQEQAALDRLVDQELLRQHMRARNLPPPDREEVDRSLREFRQQLPGAGSEGAWRSLLARYMLTEEQVRQRLSAQLELLRFIDAQIRPGVRVDNGSVLAYYRDKLLPQLRRTGAASPPVEEVSGKIREILVQQRVDELLQQWLQELRKQSDIRVQPGRATAPPSSAVGDR